MCNRREVLIVCGVSLAFALLFCWPLLLGMHSAVIGDDWDTMLAIRVDAYRQVMINHVLPIMDPWRCGGLPLWGNPISMVGGLGFWLSLPFGVFVGTRLEIILSLAIGFGTSYALGRVLGLKPLSSTMIALTFCGSNWYFLKMSIGHLYAMQMMYEPGILALLVLGWYWRAALLLMFAVLSGSPNLVYGVFAIGLWCAIEAWWNWKPELFVTFLIVLGLAVWLLLPKIVPVLEMAALRPRSTIGAYIENNPPLLLLRALLDRSVGFRDALNGYGWWELGCYVGGFGALALVGALRGPTTLSWTLTAVVLGTFAYGHGLTRASLYDHLHLLPAFDSLRAPSRFMVQVTLMVAVLAGYGAEWLAQIGWPETVLFIALFAAFDCWLLDYPLLQMMTTSHTVPVISTEPFHQVGRESMLKASLDNAATSYCYEYFEQGSYFAYTW